MVATVQANVGKSSSQSFGLAFQISDEAAIVVEHESSHAGIRTEVEPLVPECSKVVLAQPIRG